MRSTFTARVCAAAAALALLLAAPAGATEEESEESYKTYGSAEARKVVQRPERWITADHSRHEALKKEFVSGPQVTEACLSCHNQAAEQFHQTIHWTWICPADPAEVMGKAGLTLNNF